ncbi:hypothetical protein PT974_05747 [Cladobotryum mycophilum]|uniref:Heterokaryon incompatibility domain-containing protein n=1 Tax=Cladobotryum mycophilum TaxID=491253 RepID=A0ABR0SJP1_9HYPO
MTLDIESRLAGQPKALCSECQKFISWTKSLDLSLKDSLMVSYKPTFEALKDSATTCPLCQYVFQEVLRGKPRHTGDSKDSVSYRIFGDVSGIAGRRFIQVTWIEDLPFPSAGPRDPVYYLVYPEDIKNRVLWQNKTPSFESRLTTISEWIANCDHHHTLCTETPLAKPRRLLDLKDLEGSNKVKLVDTCSIVGVDIKYATLSHCWGPRTSKPPLRTLSTNLQSHFEGIPLNDLTLNFRDAVSISFKLGLRYLWIDSLCIIQDDTGDWEVEAAKMADIYRQSYINLAASAAHDAHGGIIGPSSLHLSKLRVTTVINCDFQHMADPGSALVHDVEIMIRPGAVDESSLGLIRRESSPYFSRAWVLQEIALAPRTVYFTTDQMVWQCRHNFESEDGTWWSVRNAALNYGLASDYEHESMKTRYDETWTLWIESYATRQLTFASDAGAAAAGLINFHKGLTGYTPMLGLWKETLSTDLQWLLSYDFSVGAQPPPAPATSSFPTWSWLCVLPCGDPGVTLSPQGDFDSKPHSFRVEQWEERWSGPAFTSKLEHSKLVVSTLVLDGVLFAPSTKDWITTNLKVKVQGDPSWSHHPDIQYSLPPGSKHAVKLVHLTQMIHRGEDSIAIRDSYLVVRKKMDNPPRYERLGAGRIHVSLDSSKVKWDATGHCDRYFKESDRQSIELV